MAGERQGSSPRIRGKLASTVDIEARAGLIPAHTGKTAFSNARRALRGAHPRAYGENTN